MARGNQRRSHSSAGRTHVYPQQTTTHDRPVGWLAFRSSFALAYYNSQVTRQTYVGDVTLTVSHGNGTSQLELSGSIPPTSGHVNPVNSRGHITSTIVTPPYPSQLQPFMHVCFSPLFQYRKPPPPKNRARQSRAPRALLKSSTENLDIFAVSDVTQFTPSSLAWSRYGQSNSVINSVW